MLQKGVTLLSAARDGEGVRGGPGGDKGECSGSERDRGGQGEGGVEVEGRVCPLMRAMKDLASNYELEHSQLFP